MSQLEYELVEHGSAHQALIAFGANLGDRESNWHEVLSLLPSHGIQVLRSSRLFETAPVGGPLGQATFLNAALTVQTTLTSNQLVSELLAVEREIGRVRETRWGPRLVDLDLMLYEQEIQDATACLVPHPRMSFRRFMLEPGCEVANDWIHPITLCTLGDLLHQLERTDRRAKLVFDGGDVEENGRELATITRILEDAGWTLHAELPETHVVSTGPVWTVLVSNQRHPDVGAVHGPYLMLAASDPGSWETEIRAAIQAMTR